MKKFEKIVIASQNPAKVERYGRLFSGYARKVLGLRELGITERPDEKGTTAEENVQLKARFYSIKTGLLAFSEDEALYVDFLPEDKQPGVYVCKENRGARGG